MVEPLGAPAGHAGVYRGPPYLSGAPTWNTDILSFSGSECHVGFSQYLSGKTPFNSGLTPWNLLSLSDPQLLAGAFKRGFKNILPGVYCYSWQECWSTTLEVRIPAYPGGTQSQPPPLRNKFSIFIESLQGRRLHVLLPSGCHCFFPQQCFLCSGSQRTIPILNILMKMHTCAACQNIQSDDLASSHLSLAIDFFKNSSIEL